MLTRVKTRRQYVSGVGMESGQKIVDSEIGHQDRYKSQQEVEIERLGTVECRKRCPVEREGVDKQGYERPGLLGVPSPITPP